MIKENDDVLLVVDDRGVEHDLVNVLAEDVDSLVVRFLLRIVLRWRRSGWGLSIPGLGLALSGRLLRPGRQKVLHSSADRERKEKQNPGSTIPQARNIPSWHTPVEVAILSVAAVSLLSYAICRRAPPS